MDVFGAYRRIAICALRRGAQMPVTADRVGDLSVLVRRRLHFRALAQKAATLLAHPTAEPCQSRGSSAGPHFLDVPTARSTVQRVRSRWPLPLPLRPGGSWTSRTPVPVPVPAAPRVARRERRVELERQAGRERRARRHGVSLESLRPPPEAPPPEAPPPRRRR
jgi:hypothetical protein